MTEATEIIKAKMSRSRRHTRVHQSRVTTKHKITTTTQLQIINTVLPQLSGNLDFVSYSSEWQTAVDEEHNFMNGIRTAVQQYRQQSAAHYSTQIEVHQAIHDKNPNAKTEVTSDFKIVVGFHNFGTCTPLLRICRPKSRRRSGKNGRVVTSEIEIFDNESFISIQRFLNRHFPALEVAVGEDCLFRWWSANGKTFNWTGLPTELKENIVRCCMHNDHPRVSTSRLRRRLRNGMGMHRIPSGPQEVTDQIGMWFSLLHVSHQVRALTLRLCFTGSSDLEQDKGLCIDVSGYEFDDCMRRLGRCPQMIEADSLATSDVTRHLARLYNKFPKIYPDLARYATMRHGIRKVHLQLDFLDSMHFFKVTAGEFYRFWQPFPKDYHIIGRLPHLNELIIKLPDPRGRLEDTYRQLPGMWYKDFECPRFIHRLIYERAAEALAPIENVKMYGFMDETEELRFRKLHEDAKKALLLTHDELAELYMDIEGGISLDEPVASGSYMKAEQDEAEESSDDWQYAQTIGDGGTPFWPPKCRCKVLCRKALFGVQDDLSVP
ncbi:hypothetical protein ACN47E_000234 [Coniothyrium glycines]